MYKLNDMERASCMLLVVSFCPLIIFFYISPIQMGTIWLHQSCLLLKNIGHLAPSRGKTNKYLFTLSTDGETIPWLFLNYACAHLPDYVILIHSTECAPHYWGITFNYWEETWEKLYWIEF